MDMDTEHVKSRERDEIIFIENKYVNRKLEKGGKHSIPQTPVTATEKL
jgi:hypothetical protein